jgi:pimeloyl-ACP methyl ester carboxylesterase
VEIIDAAKQLQDGRAIMKQFQKLSGGKFNVEMEVFGKGEPLLFLHGLFGHTAEDSFLEELGRDFHVIAPHLPGFGESSGAEFIDDVVDAALFYHELMDELKIPSAYIVGHSMGAMLAAEVAALDVHRAKKLVLATPLGLWLDEYPIPDLFATLPFELGPLLFHDPKSAMAQAMTSTSSVPSLLGAMSVNIERTKRFGMASKFLYPIPYRGLKKRAYRIQAPTLVLMGESDHLLPMAYGQAFTSAIKNSKQQVIPKVGHMMMYEQQGEFSKSVTAFLKS